ncbi:hypothetical protein [Bacillus thuringiensis]|uniref:hypothetical protein n=1 Tax=Bacillus cereus group TaxID=86661 RepID=UPI001298E2E0|nr:hypothetical protein [Bacillus thuringiensis]MEB9420023.1 hypothetical protein [Bacillus cereus]MEB9509629.1 hypothetical protein [Bacillus cereus]MEB9561721.1 hypothetical protein [Bacillus cereus]MRC03039.1 hypothetical protein [Bacillus thuringiensis]MRC76373.1 hypothetical protein [Bacillus thuringiensis]
MLIGPSLTLEKLEEKMQDKLYDIKMNRNKKVKELETLHAELNDISKTVYDEVSDSRIANPKYVKLFGEFNEKQKELSEMDETQTYIESKLQELEDIEERSKGKGNINKAENKITLSLNDCLKLGIELEGSVIK